MSFKVIESLDNTFPVFNSIYQMLIEHLFYARDCTRYGIQRLKIKTGPRGYNLGKQTNEKQSQHNVI